MYRWFRLTEYGRSLAEREAAEIPLLKDSYRKGGGRLVGIIGELIVEAALSGERKNDYDRDVVYGDGIRVEVKTKESDFTPKPDWNCTVYAANARQKCDEYAFVRVKKDYSGGWYLGKISRNQFLEKAVFAKKGDLDPKSHIPYPWPADCYNLTLSELK
jgi:CBS domain-containing protein